MGIGAILSFLNTPNIHKNNLNELLTPKSITQTKPHIPQRIPYDTWQEARSDINTPEEVAKFEQTYMQYRSDAENYGYIDYYPSFELIFKQQIIDEKGNEFITGDCFAYASIAAGLLSNNDFEPLIIKLNNRQSITNLNLYLPTTGQIIPFELSAERRSGHAMFIYPQENNKWHAINNGHLGDYNYSNLNNLAEGYGWVKFSELNIEKVCSDWLTYHGDMELLSSRNTTGIDFVSGYTPANIILPRTPRGESTTLAIAAKEQKNYMKEIVKHLMNEEPCVLPLVYHI